MAWFYLKAAGLSFFVSFSVSPLTASYSPEQRSGTRSETRLTPRCNTTILLILFKKVVVPTPSVEGVKLSNLPEAGQSWGPWC